MVDLTNKLYDFWIRYDKSMDGNELRKEITINLEYDIDKEIDYVRLELDKCSHDNAIYQTLEDLWDDLNYYKGRKENE